MERANGYLETSFLRGRAFTSPADFNTQLTDWLQRANARQHRRLDCRPIDRWEADKAAMLELPPVAPILGWRTSTRLPRDHYVVARRYGAGMGDDLGAVVRTGYDAAMSSYAHLEQARWPRDRWLRSVATLLTPNAEVLDLGCATGVPTCAVLAPTFRVTGVDISPAQIEQARANVPAATFICDDLRTVEFTAGQFDAVVSLYTFDHVPRDQHGSLLARIHRWLRPGGYLLLSIEDTDEPGRTVEWLGVDMHFSMFDAERTRRLVMDAGFVIVRTAVETQIEGDTEIPYTWILAQAA